MDKSERYDSDWRMIENLFRSYYRVPDDLYEELNTFASKTELSRNEIITILLKEALNIAEIDDHSVK